MNLDPSVISGFLIAAASVLGWLYTKASAQSKAAREELRWRRKLNTYDARWIYRLERGYDERDWNLPEQPDGREEHLKEEW